MSSNHVVLLHSEAGRKLVRTKCKEAKLDQNVLEQLTEVIIDQQGKLRRRGITEQFNEIFDSIDIEEDD